MNNIHTKNVTVELKSKKMCFECLACMSILPNTEISTLIYPI